MDIQLSFLELRCKEVINLINGKRLGHIIDVVFDVCGKIHGIVLPAPRRFLWWKTCEDLVIKWCDIEKIGADVILVKPGLHKDKHEHKHDGHGQHCDSHDGKHSRHDEGCRVKTAGGFQSKSQEKFVKAKDKRYPYNKRHYNSVFEGQNLYDIERDVETENIRAVYSGGSYDSADGYEQEYNDGYEDAVYEKQIYAQNEFFRDDERQYVEIKKEMA